MRHMQILFDFSVDPRLHERLLVARVLGKNETRSAAASVACTDGVCISGQGCCDSSHTQLAIAQDVLHRNAPQ